MTIKTKILRGEHWEIEEIESETGKKFFKVVNTHIKDNIKNDIPPTIFYITNNKEDAIFFLESLLNFGDKVEVILNNGAIIEGTFVRCCETICGFDLDGKQKCVETGFGVVGKIQGSKDTVADWELKPEQCKDIRKII